MLHEGLLRLQSSASPDSNVLGHSVLERKDEDCRRPNHGREDSSVNIVLFGECTIAGCTPVMSSSRSFVMTNVTYHLASPACHQTSHSTTTYPLLLPLDS